MLDGPDPDAVAKLSEHKLYTVATDAALDVSSEGGHAALSSYFDGEPSPRQSHEVTDVAERVAAAEGAKWWSEAWSGREQIWLSRTDGAPDAATLPVASKGKPSALLWTSSVVEGFPSAYWPVVTSGELGSIERIWAWSIEPVPGLQVFEIQTAEDWRWLCSLFPGPRSEVPPYPTEPGRRRWWRGRKAGASPPDPPVAEIAEPDWSMVAREFDGVHLSAAGLVTAQGAPLPLDDSVSVLWGWDVESTAWFKWPVRKADLLEVVLVGD